MILYCTFKNEDLAIVSEILIALIDGLQVIELHIFTLKSFVINTKMKSGKKKKLFKLLIFFIRQNIIKYGDATHIL